MSDFEKQYYEAESFWGGHMLQDPANQERIMKTADLIPPNVESLADIGCGNGVFVNYLNKFNPGLQVMALDRSEAALKYVKTNKQLGDISDIPLADKSIDCVTCLEVIEHLPVTIYNKALSELTRVSNEYVIVSVPFEENLEEQYNQCPSCKTIFNYELHLRRFDDNKMQALLNDFGFSCLEIDHFGTSYQYLGHYTFRKMFYKEQFKKWQSPICPLCGYAEHDSRIIDSVGEKVSVTPSGKRKLISYLTGIPKMIWPKIRKDYWVMGLYRRN